MRYKFATMALIALVLAFPANAAIRGMVQHQVQVVDDSGVKVTDINEVYIYLPDTTTNQVIYKDRGLTQVITLPMTTSSTNTTLSNGYFTWWGADGYDFRIGNDTVFATNGSTGTFNASRSRIVFPYYLSTISSTNYTDAQTITMGTDSDWVITAGATGGRLTATPGVDDSDFRIGSTNYTSDLKLYGATSDADMYWDASEDTLELLDNAILAVGTGDDYTISHDGSNTTQTGTLLVTGEHVITAVDMLWNDTYDVSWDTSRDQLLFEDNAVLGIGGAHDAAGDVTMTHDGSDFYLDAAIADEGFLIGDTTSGFDIAYRFETAGEFRTDYDGDFINLTDDMELRLGTGASSDGDFKISSNSSNVLQIEQVVADTGTVTVGADGAGIDWTFYGEEAGDSLKWDGTGASQLIFTGADSSGTLLDMTAIDTTGNSDSITIAHSGTGAALQITSSEADTQLIELISAANQTTWLELIDGSTGNWIGADNIGMLHLQGDTALAHAGASLLQVTNSAQPITAAEGFLARFVDTGTARTNAYAVEIEVTATTGGLYSTGHITGEKGIQVLSQAVTATADGLTTGLIPDHASFVTVTSDSADKVVVLPAAVVGHHIRIIVAATGAELQTLATSNATINGVDCDGSNEMAMTAASIYHLECVAADTWIAYGWSSAGAAQATIVPDADA